MHKPEVTMVLLSCGEETEAECLQSIQPFRDKIELIEIRNVSPQIKALNLMIESVQTEFFIPLDADLILHPNAYERIRKAISWYREDSNWHTILFPLWDTLTERNILALKVLRSAIAKAHPFKETATPDVEHFKRLTDEGYTCITRYIRQEPIGNHVVRGKYFCYHKYKDVYRTLRVHGWEWDPGIFMGGNTIREKAKHHFDFFLRKWLLTDNPDYLHCIAGMVDGLTSLPENRSKDLSVKDYKIEAKDAVHCFYEWFLPDSPFTSHEYYLF